MALTKERAEARFEVIKTGSITYDFHISVAKETFKGLSEITFDLVKIPQQLPLDFKGKIDKLVVNGSLIEVKIEEGFVLLDVSKLKVGTNNIAVLYHSQYANDGSGLVSFIDVDGKQYLYTQFEPYYANRVFACFDQPNLKAQMRLNLICPTDWKKILSNEYPVVDCQFSQEKYSKETKTLHKELLDEFLKEQNGIMNIFPATKVLPTYLFCFIVGPYEKLDLPVEKRYNNIPMALYCIESLYVYLEKLAPFMFEVTIQSMRFFESFFGYKFAFNKYDQVYAHQYKWGAMENAGIVTFNDIYIWKEKVSNERMLGLANTISHQLAHHWFGNLVTMQWWDDLWLNQSFADFISHFCLEKIKKNITTLDYESSFASFLQRKGWGYHEDQMITTHPIRGEVANTSVADSIFDGITYAKGAATMKQLLFLMKQENFSKALSEYFNKYQWSNATIEDFLGYMQKHFKIEEFSLTDWRKMWLQKASLNQIQAFWNPEDKSPNAKLAIQQTCYTEDYPTLRYHKILVGLFKEDLSTDVIEVLVRPQKEVVVEYDGSKNYKAILLNYGDQTFVKNVIDSVSLDFFMKNINNMKDLLSRTLIWRSFFEMIKDAKMTSHKFVDIVVTALANQQSDSIFEKQFDFVNASITAYTPEKYRSDLKRQMFKFIYDLIPLTSADKNNRITIMKNKLLNFAGEDQEKNILLNWMKGSDPVLKDHAMSIGQKWSTVVKIFASNKWTIEEKEALFEDVKKEDSTDTSKNKRFTCDALKSSEEQFENIYNSLKSKECKHSITVKNAIASGWNHPYHKERVAKYRDRIFKDIIEASKEMDGDHLEIFYEGLQPFDDDLEYQIENYQKVKFGEAKFDKNQRDITKMIDQLKKQQKAYKLYEKAGNL